MHFQSVLVEDDDTSEVSCDVLRAVPQLQVRCLHLIGMYSEVLLQLRGASQTGAPQDSHFSGSQAPHDLKIGARCMRFCGLKVVQQKYDGPDF